MTYLGLMEAEAERRETQRIGKRIGPGAVFSCGGNSASNSMSPGQGYLFVKCSPEHPSWGRVSYKAARREKTQQGNLEGSVPRPEWPVAIPKAANAPHWGGGGQGSRNGNTARSYCVSTSSLANSELLFSPDLLPGPYHVMLQTCFTFWT